MKKSREKAVFILALFAFLAVISTFAADKAPRSPGYGAVMQGNAAVDFTVADYLWRPHLIGDDLQFVSGYSAAGGTMIDGAFSFQGAGMNFFGSMANNTRVPTALGTATVSQVRAGVGSGSTFGAGIMYELNKLTNDNELTAVTVTTEQMGDAYGVFGSINLGIMNIWLDISRTTGFANATTSTETAAGTTDDVSTTTGISVGVVKDTEGEGDHAVGVTLNIALEDQDNETPVPTGTESNSLGVNVNINHGVPFKYNDQFAVFAGSIINIFYISAENTTADTKETDIAFTLAPNIEFQKNLGKGFEISLGSSINFFTWSSDVDEDALGNETTITGIETGFFGPGTALGDVALGLRWEKDNVAVDGQMAKGLLRNGPDFIGGAAPGVFSSVGLTIGF